MFQYFKNIWSGLSTSLIGMNITRKHLFAKKVTIQYPDERFELPENARNRLSVDMKKCTGCLSCSIACPVKCIKIETLRVTPDDPEKEFHANGKERKLWVTQFEIDFAKCCFCGLCTAACPTDAIKHTIEFEYSGYSRESLVYNFQTITPEKAKEKVKLLEELRIKESNIKPGSTSEPGDQNSAG
jgi:formate hydrogenlyase subunit 6/NADH:ubiquinone oxidoreductase subunit I